MRLAHALLVIVDISGYTAFITNRQVSLLHAEQIITDLMEAVIDRAEHPLSVNKLEGDAALLFREHAAADAHAATVDVLAQVGAFFPAFAECLARIRHERRHCSCDACTNTDRLCLKAFVHRGEIAIKRVSRFEELAGEDVIAIHRMLKNSVPSREYVLVSTPVHDAAGDALASAVAHVETLDGIGEATLWLVAPGALPAMPPRAAAATAAGLAASDIEIRRESTFHHLPGKAPAGLRGLWAGIWARVTGA
jgi:hypothetical protein